MLCYIRFSLRTGSQARSLSRREGCIRGQKLYCMWKTHGDGQQSEPFQSKDSANVFTQLAENAPQDQWKCSPGLRLHEVPEGGQSSACRVTASGSTGRTWRIKGPRTEERRPEFRVSLYVQTDQSDPWIVVLWFKDR